MVVNTHSSTFSFSMFFHVNKVSGKIPPFNKLLLLNWHCTFLFVWSVVMDHQRNGGACFFYFLNAISRFKHQNCLLLFKYKRKDIVEFSKKDKTSKWCICREATHFILRKSDYDMFYFIILIFTKTYYLRQEPLWKLKYYIENR